MRWPVRPTATDAAPQRCLELHRWQSRSLTARYVVTDELRFLSSVILGGNNIEHLRSSLKQSLACDIRWRFGPSPLPTPTIHSRTTTIHPLVTAVHPVLGFPPFAGRRPVARSATGRRERNHRGTELKPAWCSRTVASGQIGYRHHRGRGARCARVRCRDGAGAAERHRRHRAGRRRCAQLDGTDSAPTEVA